MSNIDGLTVDCASPNPQVFFRNDPDELRTRFTLAHELGHILLGWHLGLAECSMTPTTVRHPDEQEADAFAAELLIPTEWIHSHSQKLGFDMEALIEVAQIARASTTASLIALCSALLPGWAFQMNNKAPMVSDYGRVPTIAELNLAAFDRGTTGMHGQSVRWWRLLAAHKMHGHAFANKDEARIALDESLSASKTDLDRQAVEGTVAGHLGHMRRKVAGDALFSHVLYALGDDPLFTDPGFRAWLEWKISA